MRSLVIFLTTAIATANLNFNFSRDLGTLSPFYTSVSDLFATTDARSARIWSQALGPWKLIHSLPKNPIAVSGTTVVYGNTSDAGGAGSITVYNISYNVFWQTQPLVRLQKLEAPSTHTARSLGSRVEVDENTIIGVASGKTIYIFTRDNPKASFQFIQNFSITDPNTGSSIYYPIIKGNTLVFGVKDYVYVYKRGCEKEPFSQTQIIKFSGTSAYGFGTRVVQMSGNLLVVSRNSYRQNGTSSGAVDIYERVSFLSDYTFLQRIFPTPLTGGANFGYGVAIEGNIIAVGARNMNSVFIFIRENGSPFRVNQVITMGGNPLFGSNMDMNKGNLAVTAIQHSKVRFFKGPYLPASAPAPAVCGMDVSAFAGLIGLPTSWTSGDPPCGPPQPWEGIQCSGSPPAIAGVGLPGLDIGGLISFLTLPPRSDQVDISGNPNLKGTFDMKSLPAALVTLNASGTSVVGSLVVVDAQPNTTYCLPFGVLCKCPPNTISSRPRDSVCCTGRIGCESACHCTIDTSALQQQELYRDTSYGLFIWSICLAGCVVIVAIVGRVIARQCQHENFISTGFMAHAMAVVDVQTDVAFIVQLYSCQRNDLGALAIGFLIASYLLNAGALINAVRVWKENILLTEQFGTWIRVNGIWLALLVCVTGSAYTSVALAQSNFAGVWAFNMPVTKRYRYELSVFHVLSTVFVENFPQLCLQINFIVTTPFCPRESSRWTTYIAVIFSSFRLVFGILQKFIQVAGLGSGSEVDEWFEITIKSNRAVSELRKLTKRFRTRRMRKIIGISIGVTSDKIDMLPLVFYQEEVRFRATILTTKGGVAIKTFQKMGPDGIIKGLVEEFGIHDELNVLVKYLGTQATNSNSLCWFMNKQESVVKSMSMDAVTSNTQDDGEWAL